MTEESKGREAIEDLVRRMIGHLKWDLAVRTEEIEGDIIRVDLRDLAENQTDISFDRVLLVGGESAQIGQPYVSGATVKAFLNARVQTPGKNTTPKLQQAMATSAGRIRVDDPTPGTSAQEPQP